MMTATLTTTRQQPTHASIHAGSQRKEEPSAAAILLKLHRLLYAMERETTTTTSVLDRQLRLEHAQALFASLSSTHASSLLQGSILSEDRRADLAARIQRQALLLQAESSPSETHHENDLIQRIFFKKASPTTESQHDVQEEEEEEEDLEDDSSTASPGVYPSTTRNDDDRNAVVADLQEAQREQIEEAIRQMALQMKQETARIHDKLQKQNAELEDMQDVVTDNVAAVTDVASDVQAHVSRQWARTIGTWTLLLTMAGAFVFSFMTIQMVPKRPGACLFYCDTPDQNEYCRILPSGRRECWSVEELQQQQQAPPARPMEDTKETIQQECQVGMDGSCIQQEQQPPHLHAPPSFPAAAEEEQEGAFSSPPASSYTPPPPRKRRASAADTAMQEGGVFTTVGSIPSSQIDTSNIPIYQGKPFGANAIRKAATQGDVLLLQGYLSALLDDSMMNAQDKNGWNALHLAARAGHAEVVQVLWQAGANLHLETSLGKTALDIAKERLEPHHAVTELLLQAQAQSA